jgi:hypothetical protein
MKILYTTFCCTRKFTRVNDDDDDDGRIGIYDSTLVLAECFIHCIWATKSRLADANYSPCITKNILRFAILFDDAFQREVSLHSWVDSEKLCFASPTRRETKLGKLFSFCNKCTNIKTSPYYVVS